jgi:hypothetical protein
VRIHLDELSVKNLSWMDETKVGAGGGPKSKAIFQRKNRRVRAGYVDRVDIQLIPQKIKVPVWLKSCLSPNK